MARLVIFGVGNIGQVVYHHFATDSDYDVVGFTTDRAYVPEGGEYVGLPVVPFDEIETHFVPQAHALFVAIGYQKMNHIRAERLAQTKRKGYGTVTYVSSQNRHLLKEQVGENCFVMSGEPLQPHAKLGDDCFLWTNALVGHHSVIGDHCWIASGATIGGRTRVGGNCFIGLGATIGHQISIGASSLIGAGALVTKGAPDESVYIAAETPRFRLSSSQFLKMDTMK
jgi:sugar O-acyltransferase (sialic acid O-acetyltransferase NeuD family)